MLLASDGQRAHVVQSAGLICGFLERVPPMFRIDGRSVRVLGLTETDEFAGFGIRHAYLAGLGRGVDACHESTSHIASLQWTHFDAPQ